MTNIVGSAVSFTTESNFKPGLCGSFLDGGAFISFFPRLYFPTKTLTIYI